jgi:hypothetical protein
MKNYVRTSVKAVIIQNNQYAANKRDERSLSQYAVLPGGGQHKGETLPEALRRECLEKSTPMWKWGTCFAFAITSATITNLPKPTGMYTSWSFSFPAAYLRATNPKLVKTPTQGKLG